MSFILDSVTLPDPTEFSEGSEVGGDYNITLKGGRRRAIRYKKKSWRLGWSMMTTTAFDSLNTSYEKDTTLSFSNSDLSISATVHIDIENREFISGVGSNYFSGVVIILREV